LVSVTLYVFIAIFSAKIQNIQLRHIMSDVTLVNQDFSL
jgi:hypothetical protein